MSEGNGLTGIHFMFVSIAFFLVISFYLGNFDQSLNEFIQLISKIIPVFVLVIILFMLVEYFVDRKKLVKTMGENGNVKGWFIAACAGIISTGPIYVWYPLLNEMQKHGVKNQFVVIFLYNRAIKPALLPMMVLYFGVIYTIVLTVVVIFASILNGIVVEKVLEVWK